MLELLKEDFLKLKEIPIINILLFIISLSIASYFKSIDFILLIIFLSSINTIINNIDSMDKTTINEGNRKQIILSKYIFVFLILFLLSILSFILIYILFNSYLPTIDISIRVVRGFFLSLFLNIVLIPNIFKQGLERGRIMILPTMLLVYGLAGLSEFYLQNFIGRAYIYRMLLFLGLFNLLAGFISISISRRAVG